MYRDIKESDKGGGDGINFIQVGRNGSDKVIGGLTRGTDVKDG